MTAADCFLARLQAYFHLLLPLLRRKNHHVLRRKRIILHGAPHHHVIAWLDVRHRDTLASSAQRCFLVQLQSLRDVVRAQHCEFRRVDGFYFTHDKVFPKLAESSATANTSAALRSAP